jgi:hypothetical protein
MVDINHKEEIAKIIENHGATRQSTFVAAEILRYLSSIIKAKEDYIKHLEAQLSTARAETAKEIIGRLEGAYLAAPKFKDKIILQRQIEKLKVEYLAPDKEGGK